VKSSNVKLTVFDVNGRIVNILLNNYQSYGTYRVDFDGSNLSSGVYMYRIETPYFSDTKKLIILK